MVAEGDVPQNVHLALDSFHLGGTMRLKWKHCKTNPDLMNAKEPALMSTATEPQHRPLTADELTGLSDRVGRIVMSAKKFAHPEQGEGRRVSAREIAESLNVSHTAVNKVVSALPSREAIESRPGRTYQYSLADAVQIREAMDLNQYRAPGEPCVTLGVMNFKGGVAKSTTTAHAAQHLAMHGLRVLAIDCDPQATLSTLFGIHPDIELDTEDTLVPFLSGEQASLQYCIRSTEIPTLSVIPANVGLANADFVLPARQRDERSRGNRNWFYMTALADGIRSIEADYDVVLLDCPPSMSYLTTTATQACDALLVPMRPSMPDFASSAQFIRMFSGFQAECDGLLGRTKAYDWMRVLITLGENNNTSAEMEEIIRKAYGGMVMTQKFPYLTAVATAAKRMRTIYDVSRADIDSRQLSKATHVLDELCGAIERLVLLTRARLTAANRMGEAA